MTDEVQQLEEQPVFLQRAEVERRVGLSKSAIYDRVAKGTFPAPVKDLDTETVWWVESEVRKWQRERIEKRNMGRAMGRHGSRPDTLSKSVA